MDPHPQHFLNHLLGIIFASPNQTTCVPSCLQQNLKSRFLFQRDGQVLLRENRNNTPNYFTRDQKIHEVANRHHLRPLRHLISSRLGHGWLNNLYLRSQHRHRQRTFPQFPYSL